MNTRRELPTNGRDAEGAPTEAVVAADLRDAQDQARRLPLGQRVLSTPGEPFMAAMLESRPARKF
jgi:hypothetical protein